MIPKLMHCLIGLLSLTALLSCHTTKRTAEHASHSKQDTTMNMRSAVLLSDSGYYVRTVRDTSLTVPARQINDTLTRQQLEPVYTATGAPVTRPLYLQGKGVTVRLTPLPGGKVAVQSNCDSLVISLTGRLEEIKDQRRLYAAYDSSTATARSDFTQSSAASAVTKRINVWTYVSAIAFAFALGLLAGKLIKIYP